MISKPVEYNAEIISTNPQFKVMEVVYTSPGRSTHHISCRLPFAGESLQAVIEMYAPIPHWLEEVATFYEPTVGTTFQFAPPPVEILTFEQELDKKLSQLADWRYRQETAGIVVGGARIKTDRESQATITGAFISLSQGLATSIDWKAEGGVWVQLGLAQITPIAQAVVAHVQACFSAERVLAEQIKACTTIAELDAISFPLEVVGGSA